MDEKESIRRAQEGDREAFGPLVELYQARLRAYAARYVESGDDVFDIVQDVFLNAFKSNSGSFSLLKRPTVINSRLSSENPNCFRTSLRVRSHSLRGGRKKTSLSTQFGVNLNRSANFGYRRLYSSTASLLTQKTEFIRGMSHFSNRK